MVGWSFPVPGRLTGEVDRWVGRRNKKKRRSKKFWGHYTRGRSVTRSVRRLATHEDLERNQQNNNWRRWDMSQRRYGESCFLQVLFFLIYQVFFCGGFYAFENKPTEIKNHKTRGTGGEARVKRKERATGEPPTKPTIINYKIKFFFFSSFFLPTLSWLIVCYLCSDLGLATGPPLLDSQS